MVERGVPEPVKLVHAPADGHIHHEVVRVLRLALRQAKPVEADRGGRAERVVRGAEPVRAREREPARERVHAEREVEQRGEVRARAQPRDVRDGVEHGKRRARVRDDLLREEAGEVVGRRAALCGRRRGAGGKPFEEEDQRADRREVVQGSGVERVQIVDDEGDAERLQKLATGARVRAARRDGRAAAYVKTPGSDSVSCQPLESSSDMVQ